MSEQNKTDNKRIAKNTLLLYFRTLFVMFISLFTSRVVLNVLGIDDYGIFNVVGGVVAMFAILTGALSNAISRFITFELGGGNVIRLKKIFSTSINILVFISLIILLLGESVGLWFLNNKLNIPSNRLCAANWVYQGAIITFVVNLISVPYNAAIIAHEKMAAFAYVSILEVSLKLLIVYLLYIFLWDKLILYSILLVLVAIIIRFTYGIYCNFHFEETKYHFVRDRELTKEMLGFAGWNFFSNAAYLFNTQGINILFNMFFGVGANAARGVATQIESAILKFVMDFTTAINPQITKSYARGEFNNMYQLICMGAKFSFFLLLILSLPVFLETNYILMLWLKTVPEHSVVFLRLTIISTMIDRLLFTGYTAVMATGNIKKYVIFVTSIGCLVFPLSYIAFRLGAPAETAYVIFCLMYIFVDATRLWIMKGLFEFPVIRFLKNVVLPVLLVSALSIAPPIVFIYTMESSGFRTIITIITSTLSAGFASYFIGLDKYEKESVNKMIATVICKIKK